MGVEPIPPKGIGNDVLYAVAQAKSNCLTWRGLTMLKECEECEGNGEVENEYFRPMSFSNPYGDAYTRWEPCDVCGGDGVTEVDEDEDES